MEESYQLEGMTCLHCVATVKRIFSASGYEAMSNLETKSVSIKSGVKEADIAKLRSQLAEEGYILSNKKDS